MKEKINKTMIVKEAFEKAFGPVPDGFTCHYANYSGTDGLSIEPTVRDKKGKIYYWYDSEDGYWPGKEEWKETYGSSIGLDISEAPAWIFSDVFGEAYSKAVLGEKE